MWRQVVCAALMGLSFVSARDVHAESQITATVRQLAYPVLIGKAENPVLKIVLKNDSQNVVIVKAIDFPVTGTDVAHDVASCNLLSTGQRDEYKNAEQFAYTKWHADAEMFTGEFLLQPGVTHLWISLALKPQARLSHQITVRCDSIKTDAGDITPKTENAVFSHRIGVALRQHQQDNVHTYRIPALATSPKGTLHCVYDIRRRMGRDLQEDIDIGLSRSFDGGQTWQPMQVIMDMGEYNGLPQELNGCSDPGIIVDQATGDIFVFAVWMWGKSGKHQWNDDGSEPGFEIGKTAQLMMVHSNDNGETWSPPENLTRKLKQEAWWLLAPSPQQGIQLPEGTLVMPMQGRDDTGVPFATIMTSADHGQNWTLGNSAYSQGNECQAARLDDGSIMLNMRNDVDRFRAVFTTSDLGKTWQEHPTNRKALIEPNCNASLYRFDYVAAGQPKHVLFFSNPNTQKGRTHHTLQVSFDDGRTWPESRHVLLDEGLGAGYSSLTRVDAEHLGIVYEGSQAQLVFERIPIAELVK